MENTFNRPDKAALLQRRKELLLKKRDLLLQEKQQLSRKPISEQGNDEEYTWGQRAGQFLAGPGDVLAGLSDLASGGVDYTNLNKMFPKTQEDRETPQVSAQERWNETVNKLAGRDLSATDTTGKLLRTTGQFALPMTNILKGAKGIYGGAQALGRHLAGASGASAALNLIPSLTPEGTGYRVAEDMAKAIIGSGLAHKLVNGSVLSRGEQATIDKLTEVAGGPEAANEILNKVQQYESKIGYEPTLAEVAENPNIAQLQRSREGIIGSGLGEKAAAGNVRMREALTEAMPEPESVQSLQDYIGHGLQSNEAAIESAKSAFEPRATAAEAGRAAQEAVHGKVQRLKAERRTPTKPLYEEINKSTDRVYPKHAIETIEEELKNAKGEDRAALLKVSEMLKSNDLRKNKYPSKRTKGAFNISDIPEKQRVALGIKSESDLPRIGELRGAKKNITSQIKSAKISGNESKATILEKAKSALVKDMESHPKVAEVDTLYHRLSEPISEITGKKALNNIIKQDIYGKDFILNPSSVPEVFVGTSHASMDNAKELLKHIDKQSHELLKNYTNGFAIDKITDSMGKVKLPALETFKKSYEGKGLQAIHPELFDKKLKNLENAQLFANQYYKKTRAIADTFNKNSFNEYVGSDMSKNVGNKIFNNKSGEVSKDLVDVVSKDKTGNALDGLRRYSSDYLIKHIENAGMEGKNQILSYDKMRKFKSAHKNALETIFDKKQNEVLNEIEDVLKRRNYAATAGTAKGSPTSANIQNSSAIDLMEWGRDSFFVKTAQTVGIPKILTKKVIDGIRDLSQKGYKDALDRSLSDTKYAEFLLSNPLKNKESANAFIRYMDKYGKTAGLAAIKSSNENKE